jgi:hypothetical protein
MAYFTKEMKKDLAPRIKSILKKYGMKGTLAVDNYSTLVCNIKSGKLDIIEAAGCREYNREYIQVNHYWINENYDDKEVAAFLNELVDAMKGPDFFDESDAMTDYFHCSHYIRINVGRFDRPYILEA